MDRCGTPLACVEPAPELVAFSLEVADASVQRIQLAKQAVVLDHRRRRLELLRILDS